MIKPIVKDVFFLGQKSGPATMQDLSVGQDLMDTLRANQDHCVGMAANMIGVKTEEGCLSLTGVRKTTRYQNIEVEYYDSSWKKRRQNYSGWTAQIIQHECDHLEGIII